jgi:hypothetical protein
MVDNASPPLTDSGSLEQSTSPPPSAHNLDRSICEFESFEYKADGNVFHAAYPRDDAAPSIAVVSALAVISDTDPTAIEPLQSAVDTDALDALLARHFADGKDVDVTFAVDGHDVTVASGGRLSVWPPEASESPHADDD